MMEQAGLGAYRAAMGAAAGAAAAGGAGCRRCRRPGGGWSDRLGRLGTVERAALARGPVLWLHAASVGELRAVRPLLARAARRGDRAASCWCSDAHAHRARARPRARPRCDVAMLLPAGRRGPGRAACSTSLRLEAFFFTETEIWPTLLLELARRRRAGVHGERTRERAHRGARALAPAALSARRWRRSSAACRATRTPHASIALGADPARVHVAGQPQVRARVRRRRRTSVRALGTRLGRPTAAGRRQHARRRGGGTARRLCGARRTTPAARPAARAATSRAPRRRRPAGGRAAGCPLVRLSRPDRGRRGPSEPSRASSCSTRWVRSRTAYALGERGVRRRQSGADRRTQRPRAGARRRGRSRRPVHGDGRGRRRAHPGRRRRASGCTTPPSWRGWRFDAARRSGGGARRWGAARGADRGRARARSPGISQIIDAASAACERRRASWPTA